TGGLAGSRSWLRPRSTGPARNGSRSSSAAEDPIDHFFEGRVFDRQVGHGGSREQLRGDLRHTVPLQLESRLGAVAIDDPAKAVEGRRQVGRFNPDRLV